MKYTSITPLITNITSDTINMYFKDIKKFPLLTQEEEIKYLKMRSTDKDFAINKLMEGNLRLIISIAKMYQYSNIPLEDLIQIGNIGLYKALLAYDDVQYKTKLSDYITFKVKGEILNAITTEKGSIQIPRYRSEQISRVSKYIEKYMQDNEFEPTILDISTALDMSIDDVKLITDIVNLNIISETTESDVDPAYNILETVSDTVQEEPDSEFINIVKQNLNQIEFEIISYFYGLNKPELSADQIANLYNVSVERIRFVINQAIKKLRKNSELVKFI